MPRTCVENERKGENTEAKPTMPHWVMLCSCRDLYICRCAANVSIRINLYHAGFCSPPLTCICVRLAHSSIKWKARTALETKGFLIANTWPVHSLRVFHLENNSANFHQRRRICSLSSFSPGRSENESKSEKCEHLSFSSLMFGSALYLELRCSCIIVKFFDQQRLRPQTSSCQKQRFLLTSIPTRVEVLFWWTL